ncbi:MAG: hypothetical protein V5A68_04535 [Candidatus Thermoplasmatota archaeon]
MDEDISYRILRRIQQIEKKSPSLSKIKYNFYDLLRKYIRKMEDKLADVDNYQRRRLLEEEIQNTKKIGREIYEYREKKIVLAAISKARGGKPKLNNLIETERKTYEKILEILTKTRGKLLEGKDVDIDEDKKNKKNQEDKKVERSDKKKINNVDDENKKKNKSIVLVKKDIPEFVGTDTKKYLLRKNDVLTLPEDMVKMLEDRNVIERIENT